jgi:hypothetical protein
VGVLIVSAFTLAELRLILSTVENDRQGTWGSDRGDRLALLADKVKREIKEVGE